MSDDIISAAGERAAMGGYIPQFNEFARFAYRELVNNNLEWIKIADPEAEKLDDIQFASGTEVHAYQVKWTIADQTISFLNFTTLLPSLLSSWQGLTEIHNKEKKKVIAHLLTNKTLSKHDRILSGTKVIGNFGNFYTEVWQKWKLGQTVEEKWSSVIKKLMTDLRLSDIDFRTFISHFEFHPEHIGVDLKVGFRVNSGEVDDLLNFRSFLLEKVSDPERVVPFTKQEIIDGLVWTTKFKTTFNHELSVDLNRYQSITSTVDNLTEKLSIHKSGYLFLVGGPGSGKSTLLTEWMKDREERVFKYYAFDFTNPSFAVNYQDRGDATSLYFDLVFQLKEAGFYNKAVLPYRDLGFLKSAFSAQLEELGGQFKEQNTKAIIVIDGLDHVPREYKSVKQSFLRDLPLPTDLPEGIFIVLGSQSYELEDLSQEIKAEWKSGNRNVQMNPMEKREVNRYIETSEIKPELTAKQQELLFDKSQGHPLYLSYLVERLKNPDNRDELLSGFIIIDGNIQIYYEKIWEPIRNNAGLIEMLGLMARINESIAIDFVKEWGLPNQSLLDFRRHARMLFDESQSNWTFFHNSFRLFLLSETAISPLTDEFDSAKDITYHKSLVEFYNKSVTEPAWKKNYHLYASGSFDQFIKATSPDAFFEQLINFRPPNEIRADIKLGIEIAQKDSNLNFLLRYLFALAELDRRLFNLEPAAYIEELLVLGKIAEAIHYARKGATLLINKSYALKVARLFHEFGKTDEGKLLFNLAQPEMVKQDSIVLDYHEKIDNRTYILLKEWVTSATIFQNYRLVLQKVKNIKAINLPTDRDPSYKPSLMQNYLLCDIAIGLINKQKWSEMEKVLAEYDENDDNHKSYLFNILYYAVKATAIRERDKARKYFQDLLSKFSPKNISDGKRIKMAELIITLEKDKELAAQWIEGIEQPLIDIKDFSLYGEFSKFRPFIRYNKVLNLIGKGVDLTHAIPLSKYTLDDQVIGEFQQMLFLITQFLTEGIQNKSIINLKQRVQPILQFFNRDFPMRITHWYRLKQLKTDYYDFLIKAVYATGPQYVQKIVTILEADISKNMKYWSSEHVREIANTLFMLRLNEKVALRLLSSQESIMLVDKDIDARISECMQQAKSYLLANIKEKAEEWLKKGFEESIGVGFRKDYQFNTWLDWMNLNIKKHPELAPQYITWFLSHLHHLRETTEGRAADLAAKKLLGLTFDWNSSAGINEMKWMLDHAEIEYVDAISTFIKSILAKEITQQDYKLLAGIYSELYLFFAVDSDTSLLRLLLQKGDALFSENFYDSWISSIYLMIIKNALDEHRPSLLTTLEEFIKEKNKIVTELIPDFFISEKFGHRQTTNYSNRLVTIPGHKSIAHSEVMDTVNTYEQFRDLLLQEDKVNSRYDWSEVFTKVESSIDLDRIQEIKVIIKGNLEIINFLILLSERANTLGDSLLAEHLVEESIAMSSSSGWITFFDGGTRIKSFTALGKIKGSEGIKKAFDVFSYDILHSQSVGNYAEALEEILPVIAPGYDEEAVWSQLFDYLKRLMSTSKPSVNLPDLSPQDKSPYDNIIDFLSYFSGYPVTLVYTVAQKLLASQLTGIMPYPIQAVSSLKQDDDANNELFNGILLLSQEYSNDISFFYPNLKALATSSNYMIRSEAVHLLKLNNQEVPMVTKQPQNPFYNLDFEQNDPEDSNLNIEEKINPFWQIIKKIRPLKMDLRILSKKTGIAENTLIYRTYLEMNRLGIFESWIKGDNNSFIEHLKKIELRYNYSDPQILEVKRSILKVVSELVDTEELDEEAANQFFGPRDKGPSLFSTAKRPDFISRLGDRKFTLDTQHWLSNIKNHPRLMEDFLINVDGNYVIGEYTKLTSLNWDKPDQVFMSQIMSSREPNDGWFIFGGVINGQTKDYYDLSDIGNYLLIIRQETYGNFNILSNWIAINPLLAKSLGWQPLPSKLFAWADKNGNCLIESIYWKDGNIEMPPPHLYSEAGEGWYVLATDQALEEIRKVIPILYQEKFIYRSKENSSNSNQYSTIVILD